MTVQRLPSVDIMLVRQLGRGGMATVHEAVVAGRRVALKRPRAEMLARRPETRTLFEREYHTLAQLAHPNIIEVYGYGIDAEGPYYTMELLEGGSLSELIPMEWERACGVLRDVAAALAMVHSRRLVHRDVSLHNVRLTTSGRAKLIDFGAMAPLGVAARTLGTPAYTAPEAVYHQALDQRTDLYSLGALGYRLLSGRDAYGARRLDQLRDTWRSRPLPLRELVARVPAQLDELITQLLSLNPAGRCRTAAEVFVRLSSLAGLEDVDDAEIARAYLTAPLLVGRERELGLVRRHIVQASRSHGSALLVEGPAGAGRSRLLDACILEGQLMGMLVLRASAAGGSSVSFALIASLGNQLLEADPGCMLTTPRLHELLTRGGCESTPSATSPEVETALQQEFVTWLLRATGKLLLLIVDDLHLADLDSAGVVARLADAAPTHRLVLIASALAGASLGSNGQALRLLRERATPVMLGPLSDEQTLTMVRSLFDDVANVQLAAKRIYEIARGNPRATVDLAEWLVDVSHVVHEDGRWLIPDTLSGLPLPASVDDALRHRLSGLSTNAVMLAVAIAVAGDVDLPASEYGALLEARDEQIVHAALAELLAGQVLAPHGLGYTLAQEAFRGLLTELISRDALASLHARIAQRCLSHGQEDWAIYHLFYGASEARATDLMLSRLSAGKSPSDILHSPEDRVGFLRRMLDFCASAGRPAVDAFRLKCELVKKADIKVSLVRSEIAELSALYNELTGYSDWLALPTDMAPALRIGMAIDAARARHRSLPEREQVLDPSEALPSMVEFVSSCAASAVANSEIELIEQLPPLSPFAPLSDSIRLLARYIVAVEATIGGRIEVASATFIEVLRELDGGAASRLGATGAHLRRHAVIAIGMINAGMSRSVALDYADRLEALALEECYPYAKSTSLRMRHQYHLRRGNWRQAQHWQHELELDKLTDRSAIFNPSGIYALSVIHAIVGSVAGMRDCLAQMHEYSAVSGGLRIWERFMAAEYDRLRGAGELAVPQYLAILESQAGRHMAWLSAAHGLLLCLEELGRLEEGLRLGEALLVRAEAAQLNVLRGLILRPLGLIEARLGHFERAVGHLSANIEQCKMHGMGGINLGLAYEFRARIAIWAQDRAAFQTYTELCAQQYHAGGVGPDLTARFDGLLNEARRAGVVDVTWQSRELGPMTLSHAQVELRDRLADCSSAASRGMHALHAITQSAQAKGGYLFGLHGGNLRLLASSGQGSPSVELLEWAANYLRSEAVAAEHTESAEGTRTGSDATAPTTRAGPRGPKFAGFTAQLLFSGRNRSVVGLFLLKRGGAPLLAPENDLLEVVADALVAGGDI